MTNSTVVIGGGPAGMMAAVHSARNGNNVMILEKNSTPGTKLLMTGKGRCNITNAETSTEKFLLQFGKNGKFLINAFHRFGVTETIKFFNQHNLDTKVERGGRIFPTSDNAKDVQNVFFKLIKEKNIELKLNSSVRELIAEDNTIKKIKLNNTIIEPDNVILATGGQSYPKTGSTGDGYKWAERLGHTVIPPAPALSPLIVNENFVKELEGLSLKNVKISVFQNNKKYDERFGEALFTNNGMSGPIILDLSKKTGKLLPKGRVQLFIDFKPALDFEKLDKRLIREFEKHSKKSVKNILPNLLPKSLIPIILSLSEVDPNSKASMTTKSERKKLLKLLKGLPLTVTGLVGFNKSIITSGGVSLKEIDPKTMRSKIINNLSFAGEILDLDGPTGGYNLQVCWTTGYIAGVNANKTQ
ncbi:MAG: NAD(P)/FAD-dependent oxidoreductase [Victivallales bacterium]|nr:NAD(P)/FAD-dependent oxidoreductase [Victivallales bacterium]